MYIQFDDIPNLENLSVEDLGKHHKEVLDSIDLLKKHYHNVRTEMIKRVGLGGGAYGEFQKYTRGFSFADKTMVTTQENRSCGNGVSIKETIIHKEGSLHGKTLRIECYDRLPQRQFNRDPTSRRPIQFIYIMKNKANGRYKIGISENPVFREKTLMSQEPEISLLHKWPGCNRDEEILHEKFAPFRVRGEWFILNDKQVADIISWFNNS